MSHVFFAIVSNHYDLIKKEKEKNMFMFTGNLIYSQECLSIKKITNNRCD